MEYKEVLISLRAELQKTITLGIANPELYAQQLTQLLNSIEGTKTSARAEMERLQEKIGECRGAIKNAEQMQNLLVEIVAAYNRQELKRLEEEKRFSEERAVREAAKAQALVDAQPELPSELQPEECPSVEADPPIVPPYPVGSTKKKRKNVG